MTNQDRTLLPFWKWKAEQVVKDSAAHGVFKHYREKEWYWQAYGNYCNKVRNAS